MSDDTMNPYESTKTEPIVAEVVDDSFSSIARPIFVEWEKLRILYNGIVGTFVILLLVRTHDPQASLALEFVEAVICGVGCNLCYLAGPITESYLKWIGLSIPWYRWTAFACGTLFTLLGAAAFLLEF